MIVRKIHKTTSLGSTFIRHMLVPEDVELTEDNVSKFKLHCEDGPAYVRIGLTSSASYYYNNGLIHRYDGPAEIIQYKGDSDLRHFSDTENWYLWDQAIESYEYFSWLIEMGMDIENLTLEDKAIIDLKWKR